MQQLSSPFDEPISLTEYCPKYVDTHLLDKFNSLALMYIALCVVILIPFLIALFKAKSFVKIKYVLRKNMFDIFIVILAMISYFYIRSQFLQFLGV